MRNPRTTILEALAQSTEPLNQYQLRKKTRLAKKTVERWAPALRAGRWIQVQRVERKRGPNPSEFYELTDLGRFRVAANTRFEALAWKQRQLLGEVKYQDYVERGKKGRMILAERWSTLVREAVLATKAIPGWHLRVDVKADKKGKLRGWAKVEIDTEGKSRSSEP